MRSGTVQIGYDSPKVTLQIEITPSPNTLLITYQGAKGHIVNEDNEKLW